MGLPISVAGLAPGARHELLEAPGIDLGDVQVAFLVGGHAVDAPQRAREIADGAPRIDELPVQRRTSPACGCCGRTPPALPSSKIWTKCRLDGSTLIFHSEMYLPIGVEDLDAMVVAVVDEHALLVLRSYGDAMNVVHVAGARFVARIARLAEVEHELAVLVELGDARAVVAVGDVEASRRAPRR